MIVMTLVVDSNNDVVSQRGSTGNAVTGIRRGVLKNVFFHKGNKKR